MKEQEMERLSGWICDVLSKPDDAGKRGAIRREVEAMCLGFPVPGIGQ
jgi:glycine/serine hydroxymethyltransferase